MTLMCGLQLCTYIPPYIPGSIPCLICHCSFIFLIHSTTCTSHHFIPLSMPMLPEICPNRFHLRSTNTSHLCGGFYKDGTNGTRDCCYFAALQLVLCFLFPLAFLAIIIIAAFLAFYILLFVITQPYKDAVYNKTDTPLLMALYRLHCIMLAPAYHACTQWLFHYNF